MPPFKRKITMHEFNEQDTQDLTDIGAALHEILTENNVQVVRLDIEDGSSIRIEIDYNSIPEEYRHKPTIRTIEGIN